MIIKSDIGLNINTPVLINKTMNLYIIVAYFTVLYILLTQAIIMYNLT
jgi:hypothetical protein